jgi:prepilin-type N-terminal cleavage/methylation domain-containing protein
MSTEPSLKRMGRAGFSLLEVIVSLTILSGAIISIAAATAVLARLTTDASSTVQRSATVSEAASTLTAVPWADLPTTTDCTNVSGTVQVEKCVTVENLSVNRKRFTIIVTSTMGADTTVVERQRSGGGNPFNSP